MKAVIQFEVDIPDSAAERVREAKRQLRKIQLPGWQGEGIAGLMKAPGHPSTEDDTLKNVDVRIIQITEK